MSILELETEGLTLRQWQQKDGPRVIEFYSDPQNSKYVGGPRDADQAWRGMALMAGHWHLKGFGYWAVEEKSTEQFVGAIGLWQSPGWPELELGYWIMEDYFGQGYAKQAALRCIQVANEDLQAQSLVSYIDAANIPSIKLAESLGASYEKTIELASHGPHGVYRHF
jgi:RimJ/RimL family protein N-acetyltransferase